MSHKKLASASPESATMSSLNRELENYGQAIDQAKVQVVDNLSEIGRYLAKAHSLLARSGNGRWEQWVRDRCRITPQCARNYMRAFKAFSIKEQKSLFGSSTAEGVYYLSAESTPPGAKKDALRRAKSGEQITLALAKKIVAEHTVEEEDGESSGSENESQNQPAGGNSQQECDAEQSTESSGSNEDDGSETRSGDPSDPLGGFNAAIRRVVGEWTDKCEKEELPRFARALRDLADDVESGSMDQTTLPIQVGTEGSPSARRRGERARVTRTRRR